jgi:hypothetical protein
MKSRLRAPSPALVIAVIALFVALGGTSVAAINALPKNSVGTAQLKKGAVTKAKISKGTIKALKGSRGPQGPPGTNGTNGTNGTAVAYAHILSNGTLDTAHSKNVSASSLAFPGIYCLKITVPVSNASATVDVGNDGTGKFGAASAILGGQDPTNLVTSLCPAGDNAIIGVEDNTGANASYSTWSNFN